MKAALKKDLEKLDSMARWMDSRFIIPGTQILFGFDSLLGLIPGVGDTLTLLTTLYLVGKAHQYGLPWHVKAKMIWNGFVDWLIGLVPLMGDIFDVQWKANHKNVALIREHVGS